MFNEWIQISGTQLLMILLSTIVVYSAILLYTRIVGLRSFSKMSAADFAMTIAIGSLFGSTVSAPNPTLFMGLFAIACVFAGQWVVARLRTGSPKVLNIIDNQPVLLMAGKEVLYDNLRWVNMTEQDLFSKLREANAMNFDQVRAVVLETTGDVSVMRSRDEIRMDPEFFENVIGASRLFEDRHS